MWQDLRYGARMLWKRPGFSLIVILTISLGIGANGFIFNLINALLLRPLPVDKPAELVAVYTSDYSSGDYGGSSYADYIDFRDRNHVFSGLVAYRPPRPLNLNLDGTNERMFGEIVSGNYFSVLGLKPALGRGFLPEEDRTPGASPVAVISHRLWRTRFGGDLSAVGHSVTINGQPFTIVGVAPEKYSGLLRGFAVDWWIPATMMEQAAPSSDLTSRWNRNLLVMGRLKPEVEIGQARADFEAIAARLYREWPQQWENIQRQPRRISLASESEARVFPGARTPLVIFMTLLMTVVGLVLLIACANVANLLLARAASRRKEISIRLALGAGRGRIIRQLLTESILLALLGGAAGLLLAMRGSDLLMAFRPPFPMPIELDLQSDWRVFGFMFALSLLTGIVFGLIPALAASRPDLIASLKDDSGAAADAASGGSRRGRLRGSLVIAQVALSLLLLICAGLFLRSLRNASSIDPGFAADNLLALSMDLELQGYDEARGRNFIDRLLERVRRYWPGQQPLGKHIQLGSAQSGVNTAPYLTVIGVVKDGKYNTLGEVATPFFYLNLAQNYRSTPTLILRTQGDPLASLAAVRGEVAALDKNLPLFDVKTMRQHLGLALLPARLAGSALGAFGLLALILAAAGIYGVTAYSVAQRTREIGIRMALGANARDVLRLILRQGMALVSIGMAIGLAGALLLTQLLKTMLFGVSATDPATFAGIAILLAAVALLACWIPARRAMKVDPMAALRL